MICKMTDQSTVYAVISKPSETYEYIVGIFTDKQRATDRAREENAAHVYAKVETWILDKSIEQGGFMGERRFRACPRPTPTPTSPNDSRQS